MNSNEGTLNLILEELKNVRDKSKLMENKLKKMETELHDVKKVNEQLTKNQCIKNNFINNGDTKIINNEIVNNNTVNIVAFGKENMDFVIGEIGKLCQGNKTISNFVDFVHFNKDKPENHNVYMPNRKNKNEVFVHNGIKWMLADKKNVVEHLIDKGIIYIEGKLDELSKIVSKSKYDAVERVIEAYNDNEHENNVEVTKKMTKDIEFILYNNKDLIMDTK
jgi:hypothetical protein